MTDSKAGWRPAEILILVVILALAGAGALHFCFLTDDAYITFRYASNSQDGIGYTWNPPPFRPVEGYTSFLWLLILDLTWRVTGVEPPDAANPIAIGCGLASLVLLFVALRERLRGCASEGARLALLGVCLLWVAVNPTFLIWCTSGLETALFNLLFLAWVLTALHVAKQVRASMSPEPEQTVEKLPSEIGRTLLLLSTLATLLALTRPDGLLFCGVTLLMILFGARPFGMRAVSLGILRYLPALAPMLLVAAHVLWRRWYYDEWLPNTYFAKHLGPWPEAGWRYLVSFVLEYALWTWGILALAALVVRRRERGGGRVWSAGDLPWLLALAAPLGQAAYYTFIIGGDHFEYRVYSPFVPLLALACPFVLRGARLLDRRGALVILLFVALGQALPWMHHLLSQKRKTRQDTYLMRLPLAPSLVWPLSAYARQLDRLQAWLIERHIGVRYQEHRVFLETQKMLFGQGRIPWPNPPDGRMVMPIKVPGVPGWNFPTMAILDLFGLNDRVIAHTPMDPRRPRWMAHSRTPPPGYVEAFRPNVIVDAQGIMRVYRRARPLTDDEIRRIEERFDTRWR